jgi:gamma-glutamyltranspeptidase/glutathione hydrolase
LRWHAAASRSRRWLRGNGPCSTACCIKTCAALYRAGQPPAAGETFSNPALAATLAAIAAEGADAYYLGKPAQAAETASRNAGGALAAADFAAHRGDFCTPVSTGFRGLTILECPPNTHGIAILHALDELGELDPALLAQDDPAAVLRTVQAMGRAMQYAKATVADPAGNTVCTVVVDRDGLAVTLMTSIFKRFGSGIAAISTAPPPTSARITPSCPARHCAAAASMRASAW